MAVCRKPPALSILTELVELSENVTPELPSALCYIAYMSDFWWLPIWAPSWPCRAMLPAAPAACHHWSAPYRNLPRSRRRDSPSTEPVVLYKPQSSSAHGNPRCENCDMMRLPLVRQAKIYGMAWPFGNMIDHSNLMYFLDFLIWKEWNQENSGLKRYHVGITSIKEGNHCSGRRLVQPSHTCMLWWFRAWVAVEKRDYKL